MRERWSGEGEAGVGAGEAGAMEGRAGVGRVGSVWSLGWAGRKLVLVFQSRMRLVPLRRWPMALEQMSFSSLAMNWWRSFLGISWRDMSWGLVKRGLGLYSSSSLQRTNSELPWLLFFSRCFGECIIIIYQMRESRKAGGCWQCAHFFAFWRCQMLPRGQLYILVMSEAEEVESIQQLPLGERIVAVALKQVFDQIKLIEEQEAQELRDIHQTFVDKFAKLQREGIDIVEGKEIPRELLENAEKYFAEGERTAVEGERRSGRGLPGYWLRVMRNYFGVEQVEQADQDLAQAITHLDTAAKEDYLEISFRFADNPWVQAGTVRRRFLLNDGKVIGVEGERAVLKQEGSGFLLSLLTSDTREELEDNYMWAADFINEIVPYSVEYFLTTAESLKRLQDVDEGEEEEEGEGEEGEGEGEGEGESEEEESVPQKQLKK